MLLAGWLWYATDDLMPDYQGPEPVTLTQLMAIGPQASGRWFDVTAEVKPRRSSAGDAASGHLQIVARACPTKLDTRTFPAYLYGPRHRVAR